MLRWQSFRTETIDPALRNGGSKSTFTMRRSRGDGSSRNSRRIIRFVVSLNSINDVQHLIGNRNQRDVIRFTFRYFLLVRNIRKPASTNVLRF